MSQSAVDRYQNDPAYRSLVNLLESLIHKAEFTPSEIREAAILASINYDNMNVRRRVIQLTPELHKQLSEFNDMVRSQK